MHEVPLRQMWRAIPALLAIVTFGEFIGVYSRNSERTRTSAGDLLGLLLYSADITNAFADLFVQ
jgi:hypothetical protein